MPFNQTGSNAQSNFDTYNDVSGTQTNATKNTKTGNITGPHVVHIHVHVITRMFSQLAAGVVVEKV